MWLAWRRPHRPAPRYGTCALIALQFHSRLSVIWDRLTPAGYTHTISMDSDCTVFTTVYSSLTQPPVCALYAINHTPATAAAAALPTAVSVARFVSSAAKTAPTSATPPPPELFTFNTRDGALLRCVTTCAHIIVVFVFTGVQCHGAFFKPPQFDARKYPTICMCMGDPRAAGEQRVPHVSDDAAGYASVGFVVVMADGRGSWRRGTRISSPLACCVLLLQEGFSVVSCVECKWCGDAVLVGLHFRDTFASAWAQIELEDQIDGLNALSQRGYIFPYVGVRYYCLFVLLCDCLFLWRLIVVCVSRFIDMSRVA